jgi:hypothetical protein
LRRLSAYRRNAERKTSIRRDNYQTARATEAEGELQGACDAQFLEVPLKDFRIKYTPNGYAMHYLKPNAGLFKKNQQCSLKS